jgi:hypothetical protein
VLEAEKATRRGGPSYLASQGARIAGRSGRASVGGTGVVATTKPYRRSSEQFNIRVTPEDAALIRAAFPRRTITQVAVELLVAEAKARLRNQPELSEAGERGTTEAA